MQAPPNHCGNILPPFPGHGFKFFQKEAHGLSPHAQQRPMVTHMLAVERLSSISDALESSESVSVAQLSRVFSVSEETIRRDLEKLTRTDPSVVRVHGGAYKVKSFDKEAPYQLRQTLLIEEKQRIAKRCFSLLRNQDTIMMDSSTTALFLAKNFAGTGLALTVITNSLAIISELADNPHINLILIGGNFRPSSHSFVGYTATNALTGYHADKSFVSCSGLHLNTGLTDNHEGEAQVRRLMLENASENYLLVDSEKIGRCKTNHIAPVQGLTAIFTDANLDADWQQLLQQQNIKLVRC